MAPRLKEVPVLGHGGFRRLAYAEWGPEQAHFDPAIAQRFAIPIYLDVVLWQLWDRIACPVLVLRGENSDLLSRTTTREMLHRGPAAKAGGVAVIEIPECGHAPALMDAAQVAVIKDFLFTGEPTAAARAASATVGIRPAPSTSASTR